MSYGLLTDAAARTRAFAVAGQCAVRRAGDGLVRDAVRHAARLAGRAQPRPGAWRWRSSRCSSSARCWRSASSSGSARTCRSPAAGACRADGASGFPALILLGALAMLTLAAPVPRRRGRVPRRATPAHRALAVPAVHAADRAADPAARARRRRAARAARRALRPVRAGACRLSQGARRPRAGRLPRRTERGHRHGDPGHARAQRDDRQPLARRRCWCADAWAQRGGGDGGDLRGAVLLQRRVGILAVVLLAWGYSRAIAGNDALADIGAVSFSGTGDARARGRIRGVAAAARRRAR